MIALLTFVAIIAITAIVYVRVLPDFAVVALATGFFALFLMATGSRLLAETVGFDWDDTVRIISALALLMMWCAAMTAATVKLLTILRRHVDSGGEDG